MLFYIHVVILRLYNVGYPGVALVSGPTVGRLGFVRYLGRSFRCSVGGFTLIDPHFLLFISVQQ